MTCFIIDCITKLLTEDNKFQVETAEQYRLEKQLHELKELAKRCLALEINASSHFDLPTHLLHVDETSKELIYEVKDLCATLQTNLSDEAVRKHVEEYASYLQSSLKLKSKANTVESLSPEAAKAVFFQQLANIIKTITLAEMGTFKKLTQEREKLPIQHQFRCRITVLFIVSFAIFIIATLINVGCAKASENANKYSASNRMSAEAKEPSSNGKDSREEHKTSSLEFSPSIIVSIPQSLEIHALESKPSDQSPADKVREKGKTSHDKNEIPNLTFPALIVVGICAFLTTIWAIQSYWRLVIIDDRDKRWHPPESDSDWSGPYAFHSLAQSHKEWAQLWFSWCVAIFLGGVTYAIYNSAHGIPDGDGKWPTMLLTMVSSYLHHALVYALFGFAWYWASKHYRSHWHNYVANAYRHRSLYRFEMLRREIPKRMIGEAESYKEEANKTILELFRLSGILLLIPGESSYLDKPAGEEVSKAILRMEEVANAFGHRGEGGGKH